MYGHGEASFLIRPLTLNSLVYMPTHGNKCAAATIAVVVVVVVVVVVCAS